MSGNAVERLALALGEAIGTEVELERPNDPAHGDYATSAAMRLAPVRRRAPRELGEEIAATALALPDVERAEVAGPGFVNLWLADEWYAQALDEILRAGERYGAGDPEARLRVQVELVSANPTGPVTVAHARNAAYGDSVARLLAFAGHEVEREYYYNDAGRQIELFRASVEARRRGEEPPAGPRRRRQLPLLRQGRRLPRAQVRARIRPGDLRARGRPPRLRAPAEGGRGDARVRPGGRGGAHLPARAPDPRRRAGEGVEAARRRRLPRRARGRDRRRRRAARSRARSATSSSGWPTSRRRPRSPRSAARRTRSRTTRSSSPTTSTASTTTTAWSTSR